MLCYKSSSGERASKNSSEHCTAEQHSNHLSSIYYIPRYVLSRYTATSISNLFVLRPSLSLVVGMVVLDYIVGVVGILDAHCIDRLISSKVVVLGVVLGG